MSQATGPGHGDQPGAGLDERAVAAGLDVAGGDDDDDGGVGAPLALDDGDELDPRVQRTRQAVHEAGRALLHESGPDAITHAAIAGAARVSRTTLYKHWPTRAELLLDICRAIEPRRHVEPSGDVRADLIEEVSGTAALLADPDARRGFAQMLAQAQWDDEARQVLTTLTGAGLADLVRVLDAGRSAGEVPDGVDALEVAGRLLGPMVFSALVAGDAPGRSTIERLVDDWLAAARA